MPTLYRASKKEPGESEAQAHHCLTQANQMHFIGSNSKKNRANIGLWHHSHYTHAARAANLTAIENSNRRKERRKTQIYKATRKQLEKT
ncbi:hypothetical protein AXF42_Ash017992 [Apostasia shenzhenica]|uniref:Uncharacterized protein n=1 Tax=Apostasia shenzhenica TaxID=1088818 RepID=A0A2I0A536_9ASPA|nr:hypothetical protein AXF42_Ash017992 [Apostasia shenzhenica]